MSIEAKWPNLESVSIALPAYAYYLPPLALGILYRMVAHIGYQGVNPVYRDATLDPHIKEQDLPRITGCTKAEFKRSRQFIEEFFTVKDGKWRLGDFNFIRYSRPQSREQIATDAKSAVIARDGSRCVYCGSFKGPFHYDHLFPVSKGGRNEPSNLVIACSSCNLAKGGLTLQEWVGRA